MAALGQTPAATSISSMTSRSWPSRASVAAPSTLTATTFGAAATPAMPQNRARSSGK